MYNNDYGVFSQQVTEPSGLESWLGAATGAVVALVVLLVLICIAVAVITIIAQCKLFSKAGEKWWKALIPVYNTWVQTKIANLGWWWFLIMFVLGAAVIQTEANYILSMGLTVFSFNYMYNIAKKFGKSGGFAFLCTILPFIGLPILAFGSAKYDKASSVDKNGIFSIEK